MSLHRKNYPTAYEVAAINSATGKRIFIAVSSGSKSRATLREVLFRELKSGETRLDRVNRMTAEMSTRQITEDWIWNSKAIDGLSSGDWTIRFTGRTALECDQKPLECSIYQE